MVGAESKKLAALSAKLSASIPQNNNNSVLRGSMDNYSNVMANNSIKHDVSAKYASSTVELIPSKGRGLVAGSAVRTVLAYGGVTDIASKIHSRSKNKLTIARATVAALSKLSK